MSTPDVPKYFVKGADEAEYGPVEKSDLLLWIHEHRVVGETLIRPESEHEWMVIKTLPEFAPFFRERAVEEKPKPPAYKPDKVAAGSGTNLTGKPPANPEDWESAPSITKVTFIYEKERGDFTDDGRHFSGMLMMIFSVLGLVVSAQQLATGGYIPGGIGLVLSIVLLRMGQLLHREIEDHHKKYGNLLASIAVIPAAIVCGLWLLEASGILSKSDSLGGLLGIQNKSAVSTIQWTGLTVLLFSAGILVLLGKSVRTKAFYCGAAIAVCGILTGTGRLAYSNLTGKEDPKNPPSSAVASNHKSDPPKAAQTSATKSKSTSQTAVAPAESGPASGEVALPNHTAGSLLEFPQQNIRLQLPRTWFVTAPPELHPQPAGEGVFAKLQHTETNLFLSLHFEKTSAPMELEVYLEKRLQNLTRFNTVSRQSKKPTEIDGMVGMKQFFFARDSRGNPIQASITCLKRQNVFYTILCEASAQDFNDAPFVQCMNRMELLQHFTSGKK